MATVNELKQAIMVAADALAIADDWMPSIQVDPPQEWDLSGGGEDPADGWCGTMALSEKLRDIASGHKTKKHRIFGHTPGPWEKKRPYGKFKDEVGVCGKAICTVWTRRRVGALSDEIQIVPCDEGEANLRLILKAPEMLDALKNLISAYSGGAKICGHDFDCSCPWDYASGVVLSVEQEA